MKSLFKLTLGAIAFVLYVLTCTVVMILFTDGWGW